MNKKRILKIFNLVVLSFMICTGAWAGNISGKAAFTGTAPEPQKISMDADPACAALHKETVYTEDVLANSNGTLRNVFVYVKEGVEGKSFPAPAQSVVLDQKGCHYTPHVFGVQAGQSLEIVNSDSTLHNV
ncbi:MAG: hypothetical protein ACRENF_01065, partial [Thermodesulfobacteriota bacterium]